MSSFGAALAPVLAETVLGALQSMWGTCPMLQGHSSS